MRTIIGVLATVAAATAVGFAWPRPTRPESPVHFLAGVIRLLAANRYQEAWSSLAPTDQTLAPRAIYVACESQSPIPGHLASLHALHTGRDHTGTAVTFALRIAGAADPQGVRIVLTAHAIRTRNHWAWMLPPARRTLYQSGCGLTPGPPA